MAIERITRRTFLAAFNLAAGGLALGLVPELARAVEPTTKTVKATFDPSVFIHVGKDSKVTLVCHRSEMGQGVRSSLAYLFADELGADMARVALVQADGDTAYGDQNTDGSSSIRKRYTELRRLAATARQALVEAAARQLGVPASSLTVQDSAVRHAASGRSLDFGALAEAAAKAPLPTSATLRSAAELRYIGRSLPLLDASLYVTGEATYGADVKLPGLLIAVIARPPVVGSKMVRFDAKKALAIPGVRRVVEIPAPKKPYAFQPWGGVAVLADNTWAAMRGRAALDITWSASENDGYDSTAFRAAMQKAVQAPGEARRSTGDVTTALAGAKTVVDAEYYVPHLPHAPMEPPAATARFHEGVLEIWACTQNPQTAQATAAETLGLKKHEVVVHVTFLGGAFGRKSKGDFVAEAALLTKAVGVPVRVQWSREDDVQHDYYNTVSFQKLTAGLDATGKVVAWRHRTAFPPIASVFNGTADTPSAGDLQQGVLDLALDVKNVRAEAVSAGAHVRIGWLRSVYNIFHGFAVGSFTDEIAHTKKQDPRTTLLELIGPARQLSLGDLGIQKLSNYGASLDEHPVDAGRLRAVVEGVTKLADWDGRRKRGQALGLAAHRSFLAYVGVVVALAKGNDGRVRVDEAWVVADVGTVVNLDRARSQMEGAVLFGMSLALFGGVTFKAGRAEQTNFHDLRLVRIGDAPRAIHVDIVTSDRPPAGVGEPGVPPVAPAMANALFALTGKRARELPLAKDFGYDR